MFAPISSNVARDEKNGTLDFDFSSNLTFAYILCFTASIAVVHLVSEYEFSSVLTLSVFFQALAFGLVLLQIENTKTVDGISPKTMTLFAVTFVFRLTSTLFLDGYLPLDRTGDFTYQIADVLSLAMVLKIIHSCYTTYRHTAVCHHDEANVKSIVMVCVALAIFVHPDLNDWVTFDIAWAASLYVDTAAMLPQLMMVSKTGRTPAYSSHYIFATFVSRGFSAWFWVHGTDNLIYMEGATTAAVAIVAAHIIQFLLLADFAYYYVKQHVAKSRVETSLYSGVHL